MSPYLSDYASVVVVGLGATGFSVVRYLCAHGITPTVVDSRQAPPLYAELNNTFPAVEVQFGTLDTALLTNADLVILSPGLSLKEPAIQAAKSNGAEVVGDIELFLAHSRAPVIAITGSNGKSTVTTLVGELCKAADKAPLVAGNIGKPVLDALTDKQDFDMAVLELSSFQLETTKQVPAQSAAILNISEDHMDRYDSMGDYVLAKARILRGAKRAVLPRQESHLSQITNVNERVSFGLDAPASPSEYGIDVRKSGRWLAVGDEKIMRVRDVPLVGMHNVNNVLAALALVDHLEISKDVLASTVKAFLGLPHRMQTVANARGITWVNDSKATNVGATESALASLESTVIWIAGGQGKGADFQPLKSAVGNVRVAILYGADAHLIESAVEPFVPVERVDSLAAAVECANVAAEQGDIVLLSPACASFDMFDSFEHRGTEFLKAVRRVAVAEGDRD